MGMRPRSRWSLWYRRIFPTYAAFLFCATHFPGLELRRIPGDDKTAHFLAYGMLAFLFWRFAGTFSAITSGRFAPLAALGLCAWAAIDESTQPIMGRSAELMDWLVDCAGIALAIVGLELLRRVGFARRADQRRGTG